MIFSKKSMAFDKKDGRCKLEALRQAPGRNVIAIFTVLSVATNSGCFAGRSAGQHATLFDPV